jgi:hypothetical protein
MSSSSSIANPTQGDASQLSLHLDPESNSSQAGATGSTNARIQIIIEEMPSFANDTNSIDSPQDTPALHSIAALLSRIRPQDIPELDYTDMWASPRTPPQREDLLECGRRALADIQKFFLSKPLWQWYNDSLPPAERYFSVEAILEEFRQCFGPIMPLCNLIQMEALLAGGPQLSDTEELFTRTRSALTSLAEDDLSIIYICIIQGCNKEMLIHLLEHNEEIKLTTEPIEARRERIHDLVTDIIKLATPLHQGAAQTQVLTDLFK